MTLLEEAINAGKAGQGGDNQYLANYFLHKATEQEILNSIERSLMIFMHTFYPVKGLFLDLVLKMYNAGLFALTGVILSVTKNKNWIWLPGIVTTFLIQHAVQGWCPLYLYSE